MFFNILTVIYDKPIGNVTLNGEQLKPFLLKSGARQGCLFSPLLFSIVLEFLMKAIIQEQEIKGIQIGKDEVKLSLFADYILYLKDPENSTTKLVEIFWQTIRNTKLIYRNQ
jgi:hypothetical protein